MQMPKCDDDMQVPEPDERADELADEMSEESFPASDPPSTWTAPPETG